MKQLVLVIALAGTLVVSQANASNCWVIKPEVPEAFNKARAVFIGEVIEIGGPLSSKPEAPVAERFYRIKFKVAYSWKGAGFREFGVPEIVLLSDQGAGSCFSWGTFLEGHKYLVYADETAQKDLTVQLGKRTASLANAEADVKELDRMARPSLRPRSKSGIKAAVPPEFPPEYQLLGSRLNVSIARVGSPKTTTAAVLPYISGRNSK